MSRELLVPEVWCIADVVEHLKCSRRQGCAFMRECKPWFVGGKRPKNIRVYREEVLAAVEKIGETQRAEPNLKWVFPELKREDYVFYGGLVYFAESVRRIKVGYTSDCPIKRVKTLQTSSPMPVRLVAVARGTFADERDLHDLLRKDNVQGEWFQPSVDVRNAVKLARSGKSAAEITEELS